MICVLPPYSTTNNTIQDFESPRINMQNSIKSINYIMVFHFFLNAKINFRLYSIEYFVIKWYNIYNFKEGYYDQK